MTRLLLLAALVAIAARTAAGQAVSTTGVERDTRAGSYWRLAYDNDFFTATDRYFTQGISLEVASPRLSGFPAMRLLRNPRGSVVRYGVAYADDGYTSSDLKASQILRGDHPYAGTKQLRAFTLALDTLRRQRVTSSLTLGIIGPGAAGKEIQTFIHRRTGNTIPQGWHNQIRNDLILNYETGLERELYRRAGGLLVTGAGTARVGTYNTALTLGTTLLAGRVGSPFSAEAASRRAFYLYAKPQLNAVAYDATLQGGLFNRSSPYTIATRDLSRLVYRQQVGLVYRSGRRYIEYYQTLATPEFRGGRAHRSGGFQIGMISTR
jgi:lipid A 3-O-deacylase